MTLNKYINEQSVRQELINVILQYTLSGQQAL